MKKNAWLSAVTGFAVALAIVAIGSLLFRGGEPIERREPPPVVAKKPKKPAPPPKVEATARPAPEPRPAPPIVVPAGDVRAKVEALLKEYDAIVNDTISGGPADVDRINTLRERQQRLDRLVEALAGLGPEAIPILAEALRGDARRADLVGRQTIVVRALARIPGKEALTALGEVLSQSESFALKMTVVTQLAEHGGADGIEVLAGRLHVEADARVRSRILNYLGQQKSPEAVMLVTRLARDDQDPNVRIAAIRALGEAGDPSAAPVLEQIARTGEDIGCRQNAIQIYARLVKEPAIPMLEDMLRNDPNIRIKAVAIVALQDVGGERARQSLEAAANDPSQSEDVRARARGALAALEREERAAASGTPVQPYERKLEGLRPVGAEGIRAIPTFDGKR